ncbi:hypothetical protein QR685DRAFT_432714 [Neurospora intermedia]|uniref:Uncharacterized protein n=1 Tax=Neurospora intermedia TaxID=5142 RepID=A0ABR3DQ49_NEUIN
MAPSYNSKANPNGYKSMGRRPTNFKKNLFVSPEEQAAVDEFHAFYAKLNMEEKNNKMSPYQPADHDTPKAKMENPLPPGAKGLASSRWAKKEDNIKPLPTPQALHTPQAASHHMEEARKPLLLNNTKWPAHSQFAKKKGYKSVSPEEQAAVDDFHAFYAKLDSEEKNNKKSPYQPADHDTPKAKMENPLPPGAKGLGSSRWATKKDTFFTPSTTSDSRPLQNPIQAQQISRIPKPFHRKKGKRTYNNKYGWTPEEDAAVEAFFAESPKKESKEQMDDSESVPYQAADHETPRAKMENPLSCGNKGLAGSRFAVEEDFKLLPPGEKGSKA